MGIGNSVENNTKTINNIVTNTMMQSCQSATNTAIQSQTIRGVCKGDVATAAAKASNDCAKTILKEHPEWSADDIDKVYNTLCPNICTITDVSQNQTLDVDVSVKQLQHNNQQIQNNITSNITNNLDVKGQGGIGNDTTSNLKTINKVVSDYITKEAETTMNAVGQTQVINVGNVKVKMVKQEEVAKVVLNYLQKQKQYLDAVNSIANTVTQNTKVSGSHIIIIVVLVLLVLGVGGYIFYRYRKKRRAARTNALSLGLTARRELPNPFRVQKEVSARLAQRYRIHARPGPITVRLDHRRR